MFSVKGDATVAQVTELRRETTPLLQRVDRGETVIIQKNAEAVGVLISYPAYQQIMIQLGQLESIQMAFLALKREERILQNRDQLIPLSELLAEYGIDDAEDSDEATSEQASGEAEEPE
jgi:prevent-host-death family protein